VIYNCCLTFFSPGCVGGPQSDASWIFGFLPNGPPRRPPFSFLELFRTETGSPFRIFMDGGGFSQNDSLSLRVIGNGLTLSLFSLLIRRQPPIFRVFNRGWVASPGPFFSACFCIVLTTGAFFLNVLRLPHCSTLASPFLFQNRVALPSLLTFAAR